MLNMEYKEVEFVLKGRYADRYRWENLTTTWGDGSDSRPTGQDIIDDENLRGKLSDKVFLVTGCSSGAGVATVEALTATGATVFGTARDVEKANRMDRASRDRLERAPSEDKRTKRIDWLGSAIMFKGLYRDDEYVKSRNLPCENVDQTLTLIVRMGRPRA